MKDGAKAVILIGGVGAGIGTLFALTRKAEAHPENVVLSNLEILPVEVIVGQTALISLTVENIGEEKATKEIVCEIDLVIVARRTVVLYSGESKVVTFGFTPSEVKVYSVSVDGLTDSFTAHEVPTVAEFYMPPVMEYTVKEVEIVGIPYNRITVSCPITNVGGAPGTHSVDVYFYWNGTQFSDERKTFTLQPGGTYTYTKTVDVWRSKQATCKIYGDWGENNYSEGVVAAGAPWDNWEEAPPWEDIPPWENIPPWEEAPWEDVPHPDYWQDVPQWSDLWDNWTDIPWSDWDNWGNAPWDNWHDYWQDIY